MCLASAVEPAPQGAQLSDEFVAGVDGHQVAQAVRRRARPGRPAGDYVTAIFVSKFANKAQVEETVTTVRETDGRWRVTGYTAR